MGGRTHSGRSRKVLCILGTSSLTLALAWWLSSDDQATPEVPARAQTASTDRAAALRARPSLLGGAVASALSRTGDSPVAVRAPEEGELTEIRDQLQALRAELSALRDEEAEPRPEPTTEEEAMLRERDQTHASIERIQHRMEGEESDPGWAPNAEETLRAAFESDEVWEHSRVSEVECRQTLCRVRSSHDDSSAEMRALSALGRNDVFGSSEAFSERFELDDGSIETETYITRRGHGLTPLLASN